MSDRAEVFVFWPVAVLLVASAIGVVRARNPVYAAMSLVAAFFLLAGLYLMLAAHLLAFLQVMVYAGAIMVLFLFVIMLLSLTDAELGVPRWTVMKWLGAIGAAGLLVVIATAFRSVGRGPMRPVPADFGTVKAVGRLLFTQYLLPFEAASVLLLVAIVGAVVIAKQRI